MDKKKSILLTVFLIFLMPFSSAFNASGDVYSIGSYHMGSAGNTPEGTDFSSRSTITYQQAGNDNATSEIYSLNLGWFKRIITPSEEVVEEVAPSPGAGGEGGGVGIAFDVDILEFDSPVKLGDFFDFTYSIKVVGNINNDVTIDFWIEKDEEIISSGSAVVFMGNNEEKTGTASLFLPSDIASGTYKFVLQASFQTSKGEAHRTIEITVEDDEATLRKLFDISILLLSSIIENSDELLAIVTFQNFGDEPTTVNLTFIILDREGNEIHKEEEKITVITEERFRKSFEGLNLPEGKYALVLNTLYNVNVLDEFRQDFEISKKKKISLWSWIIIGIILVIIIFILLIVLTKKLRKKKGQRGKTKLKKGMKKPRSEKRKGIYKELEKEVGDL